MKQTALLVALTAAISGQDLVVERGNPNAFQTLQAALDAAQPGQRILLRSQVWPVPQSKHGVIRKSVTIEGQFSGPEFQLVDETDGLLIEALSPGIPLVLRNLQFSIYFGSSYHPPAIASRSLSAHAVVMEDIAIDPGLGSAAYWSSSLIYMQSGRLTMRRCQVIAPDITSTAPCCSVFRQADAIDALRFAGSVLYLEDCLLKAGNASHIHWTPPSQCFDYLCPQGGVGGTAVDAGSAVCVAVRTVLSDGNGGSVNPGPWPIPPIAGHPRASRFGTLTAYDVRHELGRSDAGGPATPRGNTVRYGHVDAPLSISSARIGQVASLGVGSGSLVQPIAVALTTSFSGSVPTLIGALHIPISPPPPVLMTGIGVTNLAVPNVPELVGQTLVGQLVTLYQGAPFLSNPSVVSIGR